MRDSQLDLFAASGRPPDGDPRPDAGRPERAPAALDDDALIRAIPWASLAAAPALAAEAGRRGLRGAVPALEQLVRRFAGFGLERPVPEQVAALQALALIGGHEAAQAVARLLGGAVVQGPTRKVALRVAARLEAALPAATVLGLLQDPDPEVRADACRAAGASGNLCGPVVMPVVLDLTRDGEREVSTAAWCALGRMGRREARPALARLLRDAPSPAVIDGVAAIADEDCVILLGRIARTQPALARAALEALETIDHPRARQIVTAVTLAQEG
jgi:HEAT repeats